MRANDARLAPSPARGAAASVSPRTASLQARTDQQDVVVRVRGREHLGRGRAKPAAPVDVLEPGGLVGGPVGAGPGAVGPAGAATVDVAAEDDGAGGCATGEERPELGALRVVRGRLDGRERVEVRGAD